MKFCKIIFFIIFISLPTSLVFARDCEVVTTITNHSGKKFTYSLHDFNNARDFSVSGNTITFFTNVPIFAITFELIFLIKDANKNRELYSIKISGQCDDSKGGYFLPYIKKFNSDPAGMTSTMDCSQEIASKAKCSITTK